MSIAEKLQTIAENVPKVYNAGHEKGKAEGGTDNYYDTFWDSAQQNGERTNYNSAFGRMFNESNLKPKYPLINLTDISYMFRYCEFKGDLATAFEDMGVEFSFIHTAPVQVFRDMPYVTRIFTIDGTKATRIASLNYWFTNSPMLETIDKIILKKDNTVTFTDAFLGCVALQNITFEGVIGNNIDFASCVKLSKESIENIIGCLSDTVSDKTVTFSATAVNNAFGSSESDEWENLIAQKSDWEISLM